MGLKLALVKFYAHLNTRSLANGMLNIMMKIGMNVLKSVRGLYPVMVGHQVIKSCMAPMKSVVLFIFGGSQRAHVEETSQGFESSQGTEAIKTPLKGKDL